MKKDLVSIIIPTYNSKELLIEAVNSALNQSHKNIEVIVVDDGSTDETMQLFTEFEKLGVKCFSQKNQGACTARNLGLKNASGDYIQFLDADDLIREDKLGLQLEAMQHDNADLSMCFWGKFIESISNLQPFIHQHIDFSDIHNGKDIMRSIGMKNWAGVHHQYLIRKDVIEKAGYWDETLLNNQDGEYFSRLFINAKKVAIVKQQLAYYRVGQVGTVSSLNSTKKVESVLKSWDLIYDLVSKDADKTLLAYPKKGYFVNYRITRNKYPKYAKIFAKRFDKIKEPCFLTSWKYYWIVKHFGLYYAPLFYYRLVNFKIIKVTGKHPI
jgi:glycosyltransferase involved in cell wall biosynthesis